MNDRRDALLGLRMRIEEKRAGVSELLNGLLPIHRAVLPDSMVTAIDERTERTANIEAAETHDDLTTIESDLDALVTEIPKAQARARDLLQKRGKIAWPPPPPPWISRTTGHEEIAISGLLTKRIDQLRFNDFVLEADPVQWGDAIGHTVVLTVDMRSMHFATCAWVGTSDKPPLRWAHGLGRFGIPSSLPPLSLRTDQRRFKILSDTEVGDDRFDDGFWIVGDVPIARAILTSEVRARLLYMRDHDIQPELAIGDGQLELRWYLPWTNDRECTLPTPCIQVLREISRVIETARKAE